MQHSIGTHPSCSTALDQFTSLVLCRYQTEEAYSKIGLTMALYAVALTEEENKKVYDASSSVNGMP